MIRQLAGSCVVATMVFASACSANSDESRASGTPLSSCDAAAPTGKTTTLETKSSNGRTVEVRIPLLPEWGRPIPSGPARPGDAALGLGEGTRTDRSGAWATADTEIDFDPPAPVDPQRSGLGPQPQQTPMPPETLGISIDDDLNGTVCGQEAHLQRQHPISNDSHDPYLRGKLTITCPCGSDRAATIVVKITTGERTPPADTRSARNDRPPPHPSRFESDIALILANVQVDWRSA